jgi:hypothetical protein
MIWNRYSMGIAAISLGLTASLVSYEVAYAARARTIPQRVASCLEWLWIQRSSGDTLTDQVTINAIREFQRGYKLPVDGVAGGQTQDLMADLVVILQASLNLVVKPNPRLPRTQFLRTLNRSRCKAVSTAIWVASDGNSYPGTSSETGQRGGRPRAPSIWSIKPASTPRSRPSAAPSATPSATPSLLHYPISYSITYPITYPITTSTTPSTPAPVPTVAPTPTPVPRLRLHRHRSQPGTPSTTHNATIPKTRTTLPPSR